MFIPVALNETHFSSQHVYKLEWQPGAEGYLYWYLDDELLLGIDGVSLHSLTDSLIPVVSNLMSHSTDL